MIQELLAWLQTPVGMVLAALWVMPWKGVALWRSSRNRQLVWFIALLIFQTLAILEIVYIFGFSKPAKARAPAKKPAKKAQKRKR